MPRGLLLAGGQPLDLSLEQHPGIAEPGDHLADGREIGAAATLLLDADAQPPHEIEALVGAEHAVGGVRHPADVFQDELVGALDHARHTARAHRPAHPFGETAISTADGRAPRPSDDAPYAGRIDGPFRKCR